MKKAESMVATYRHKEQVALNLKEVIQDLHLRSIYHDDSKLYSPEVDIFTEYTPKLADIEYGSDAYKQCLENMKPALDNHYSENSHHPEHYVDGIKGMSLMDLVEMICDWDASSKRHSTGNIYKSIELNQKRFGYSDELKSILINTIAEIDPVGYMVAIENYKED